MSSPEDLEETASIRRRFSGQPSLAKRRKARLKRERREKAIVGAIIGFSLLWIGLWVGLLAGAVVLIWRVVIG